MTPRKTLNHSLRGFTLIELLVVVTLMAMAVSMAVFRLDGLSQSGRLSSASRQVESLLHLAQAQARATGEPRLIEFEAGRDHVRLCAPQKEADRWRWNEGRIFQAASGVHFERLIFDVGVEIESRAAIIRVDSDGRYPSHALLLELQGRWAVVVCNPVEGVTHRLLDTRPQARDLATLRRELMGER
jgi:type II secretion system protein H